MNFRRCLLLIKLIELICAFYSFLEPKKVPQEQYWYDGELEGELLLLAEIEPDNQDCSTENHENYDDTSYER